MGKSPDTDRRDGEADAGEEAGAGEERSSSTVTLRVRDVDTDTTVLRAPSVTADKPSDDAETADGDAAKAPDSAAGETSAVDPRLAMRDGREVAGAALKVEPKKAAAVAEAAAEAKPEAAGEDASEAGGEAAVEEEPEAEDVPEAAEEPAEAEEEPAAEPEQPEAKPQAEDEPEVADPEAAEPEATDSAASEEQPEPQPEDETRPVPLAVAATMPVPLAEDETRLVPKVGTVPEPAPEPAPLPEPSPVPEPVPEPTPAPEPIPNPEPPLPGPETTSEALVALAALTGRPASPFRTAVKRLTIWTLFLAFVVGVAAVAQLLRPLPAPEVRLSLADSYTFGGTAVTPPWPAKGQAVAEVVGVGSLGQSGPETPVPIASVTKVMNALLILQDHPLKKGETGPTLTADAQAAQESNDVDQSKVTLTDGQQLNEYSALEMLMLPSANNVARLLARWDAGSEDAFVTKMNAQAAKLGMTNTHYADPAGYNSDTRSTAKDQLKLAEQVMKSDIFRQIVAEPDTVFNNQRIYNTNYLLSQKNGVIGTKTGSSTPAGSCLMWAAVKDVGGTQRMILGVTLGQQPTATDNLLKAAQTVSQRIISSAQDALTGQTLAKQGDVVGYVDDGFGSRTPVVAAKDLTVAGWSGVTTHLSLDGDKLGHQVKAGTEVGSLSAGEGDAKAEIPVTLQHDLAPPSIMSRLLRVL